MHKNCLMKKAGTGEGKAEISGDHASSVAGAKHCNACVFTFYSNALVLPVAGSKKMYTTGCKYWGTEQKQMRLVSPGECSKCENNDSLPKGWHLTGPMQQSACV